jgi:hypothetical protein
MSERINYARPLISIFTMEMTVDEIRNVGRINCELFADTAPEVGHLVLETGSEISVPQIR